MPLEFPLPTKDKIQVCGSSQQGQAEVLHLRAALEAGKVVPTQGKGLGRWECSGGYSQSQVSPDKTRFVLGNAPRKEM